MAVTFGAIAPPARAVEWAAPSTVWVEPAGHTVDGLFLDLWRQDPAFLGNPITEELTAKVPLNEKKTAKLIVQYFENIAIAYSPDDPRGDDWTVHALPLGADALKRDKKALAKLKLPAKGDCGSLGSGDCRSFPETDHTVRWGFKAYWESHGGEPMLGFPLTEEFLNSDGWTTQYFERAVLRWKPEIGAGIRPLGKETAKRLKLDVKKIAQPLNVPVYDEELFVRPIGMGGMLGPGPGPVQGTYKEIVVSISQQAMWAYEGGTMVVASYVSTGTAEVPQTVTPIGYYSVLTKYDVQTMEGTISNEYYNVPDVPWVMYFDNLGNALHGTYWHNNFGAPMSHGCVNLPLDVASFLYAWAPIGTAVTVVG
jgi:L,D-transpeptidase catalytic domain